MSELTQYRPTAELASTDPTGGRLVAWAEAASAAHSLAVALCKTSFVPKAFAGNPSDATAAIILGDELGLSPLSALRALYVIGGTPALYARTMTALVMSHGHEIWTVEESEGKVTVAGKRKGSEHEERVTWTIARAQKAGYTNNKKYLTDPTAMLYARAAGDVARRIAPDVLAGVPYSVEEIELAEVVTKPLSRSDAAPKRVARAPKPEPVEPSFDVTEVPEVTEPEPAPEVSPEPSTVQGDAKPANNLRTEAQSRRLFALLRENSLDDREAVLAWLSTLLGRDVDSTKTLTRDEASQAMDALDPEPATDGAP